jgi:hypothetical protein
LQISKRCLSGNSVDGKTNLGKMRLEEFLRSNGKKYELRIISKDPELRIEVETLEWDGDENTKQFIVKDNLTFPIE